MEVQNQWHNPNIDTKVMGLTIMFYLILFAPPKFELCVQ